jgi:hypothetical protein
MVRATAILLSSLVFLAIAWGQEPPAEAAKVEAPVYFSGTVTQATAKSITVNRKALGSSATTKVFAIDGETKVEGKLRAKVKVTVRFVMEDEDHARAVHIIVH